MKPSFAVPASSVFASPSRLSAATLFVISLSLPTSAALFGQGSIATDIDFNTNGGLHQVASGTSYDGSTGSGAQRLVLAPGVSGTIALNAGVSFAVINNTHDDAGGVFYLDAGSRLVLNAGVAGSGATFRFTNNIASTNGGVISATSAYVSVDGATFERNSAATTQGGAIFSNASVLSISNALFTSNTAYAQGGAIFTTATNVTTVASSTFTQNYVTNNAGGAIGMTVSSTLYLNDVLFDGNIANNQAGALFNNASVVSATNVRFENNRTLGGNSSGGAAVVNNNGTMTLTNALFQSNTAFGTNGNGGAFSTVGANASTIIQSATFTGNYAENNGGAIYSNYNGNTLTLTLTDVSILNNTADALGGAVYQLGNTLNYNVTTGVSRVAGNTAAGNPSGFYITNNTPTLNINVAAGAALDMPDPIAINLTNGNATTINKNDPGIWRLGSVTTAGGNGSSKAIIAINTGTLQLYRAGQTTGSYTVPTSAAISLVGNNANAQSAFTLGAAATLLASGANTITTTGLGSINLATGAHLAFDLAGASTTTSLLTLTTGNATTLNANGWTQILDLFNDASLTASGDYKLITLSGGSLFTNAHLAYFSANATGLNGNTLILSADFMTLLFSYSYIAPVTNNVLTWNGNTSNLWHEANWKTASTTFLQGDIINLDSTHTGSGTISITTTATVGGMYLSGNKSYALTGESIVADADAGTFVPVTDLAATGKLILGAKATTAATAPDTTATFTGTLDLTGQGAAANNKFTGGVEIHTGALRVATTGQLGVTGLANLTFTGTGELHIAAGANLAYNSAGTDANYLSVADGNSAVIKLENNATLAIANNITKPFTETGTYYGGAIFVGVNSTLTLAPTVGADAYFIFTSNSSSGAGGAIYASTGALTTITNGTFANNKALNQGGAIINSGGTMSVTNAIFITNTASGNGGAVANLQAGAALDLTNANFERNAATTGGAVFGNSSGADSYIAITSATFNANTATASGGALSNQAATRVSITDALFASNTAGSSGGAINLQGNSDLRLKNISFENNYAATTTLNNGGGAISSNGGSTITGTNVTFTSNTTAASGGAVALYGTTNPNTLTLTSGTFANNTALSTNGGGAIYASGGTVSVTLTDLSLLGNTAANGNGGALYDNSVTLHNLTLATTTGTSRIAGNTATSGAANSLYFNRSGGTGVLNVTINTAPASALDMLDPMTVAASGANTSTITKNGTGTWNLGGTNLFTTSNRAASISIAITQGTLHLYRAGETSATYTADTGNINFQGASNQTGIMSFTLAPGATLSVGGGNSITATVTGAPTTALPNSAITFAPGSIISYDLAAATPGSAALLTLGATTTNLITAGALNSTLDFATINTGSFNLLTAGAGRLSALTPAGITTLIAGITSGGAPLDIAYSVTAGLNGDMLWISLTEVFVANKILTWVGANNSSWTAANWKNTLTDASASFTRGDIINLDSTNAANFTLDVDTVTSATVAGLYVSGNASYTITGNAITAAAESFSDSTAAAATGKLILGAKATAAATAPDTTATYTGTLTLSNTANHFTGGIDILGGRLVGNAANLDVGAAAITIAAPGTLEFNQTTAATYTGALAGSGTIAKTGTAALALAASPAAAYTGRILVDTGSLLITGNFGAANINVATNATLGGSNTATLGTVTVASGGVLMAGLTHADPAVTTPQTLTLTGILDLAAGAKLAYDIYGGTQSDRIIAAGLTRAGANTIDLNNAISGTYTLLTAAGLTTSATANLTTTINGGALSGRSTASYFTDGNNLNLAITTVNLGALRWSGTNTATWQDNHANWQTSDGIYLNGDSVIFDDTATGTRAVTIASTGVQVVDMLVTTTGTYTFTGGAITTSNTLNSVLAPTGTGALTLTGPGLVILDNAANNNFQGGINIASGTLQGNAATLNASAIRNNAALVFNQTTTDTYAAAITGNGALTKLGAGALTLTNAANTYTGGINVAAGTLELQNSGPSTQGALAIANNAALRITANTAYTIAHTLTGSGLLSIDAAGNAIVSTLAAPSTFTGTVALGASTFNLDASASNLVRNATLQLDAGNTTTVANGTQQLADLSLNGGKLIFSVTIPPDAIAAGIIQTGTLSLTTGTVQISTPTGPVVSATSSSLFAQAAGGTITNLIKADAVTGNATGLTLVDHNNASLAASQLIAINQGGVDVATGAYGYALANTATTLDVKYSLTGIAINTGQTLMLAPDIGDTGTFAPIISGNGNLSINAANAPVTLSGANTFTGTTTVTSGTLILGVNNALGLAASRNALVLDPNATLNLGGRTQTLGLLNTAATSTINLAAGTLTINGAGVIDGSLTGLGTLAISNNGSLTINSANPALAAATTVGSAATLTLGDLQALGTSAISLGNANSKVVLTNATSGTFTNTVTGAGSINITGPGAVTLAPLSAAFTGPINVAAASNLIYNNPGALPNNIIGSGTLNIGATAGAITLSGNNTIANINTHAGSQIILAGATSLGSAIARVALNDTTVTLTKNDTVLGNVTMSGSSRIAFGPATGVTGTATLMSLRSIGTQATLAFNTDIGAGAASTLIILDPAIGDFNIAINNTGAAPAADSEIALPLIKNFGGSATYHGSGTLTFAESMHTFAYDINSTNGATLKIGATENLAPSGAAIIAAAGAMPLTWFAELDTLSKRQGDLHLDPRTKPGIDLWLRAHARRLNVNDKDTLVPFSENQYGTEAGLDYGGADTGHGMAAYLGAYLGYGSSDRDIDDMDASGDTTSIHGGLYATLISPTGWYVDLVGKYNHFKNKFRATSGNGAMHASYNTDAFGASVEAGKRIDLDNGWFVTPGAQAAITRINSANYTTDPSTNLSVNLDSTTSRHLRAGAQGGFKYTAANGQIFQPYAKAYYACQWTTGGAVTVTGDPHGPYAPIIQGRRIEAGLGLNWQIRKPLQIYIDYECAWARDYTQPYGFNAGVSYSW